MNILITGASGGMGRAACGRLVQEGHRVFGLDIKEPTEKRPDSSPEADWEFILTDITKEASVQDAYEIIREKNIKLDAIIHHAGMYEMNSLVEMTDEELLKVFHVNFFGMARINRIFLPVLKKGAKIIVTSSELAPLDPLPFTGIYGITKTTVEKYAFSLRMELQLLGMKVIILRPGAVKTQLLDVSTSRLADFCKNTKLYACNAVRFKKIVDTVEAANIETGKIADLDRKILKSKNPRYIYSINRNPLLRLLNILPQRLQTFIIRLILK